MCCLHLAGGYLTLELPDLMELIHRMRPKLVIPMHFRTLTYRPRNTMWIESFLSNFKDEDVDFAFGHTVDIARKRHPRAHPRSGDGLRSLKRTQDGVKRPRKLGGKT